MTTPTRESPRPSEAELIEALKPFARLAKAGDINKSWMKPECQLVVSLPTTAHEPEDMITLADLQRARALTCAEGGKGEALVEIPQSDANDLDDVVRELGIESSHVTPAEAVRELCAERDEWAQRYASLVKASGALLSTTLAERNDPAIWFPRVDAVRAALTAPSQPASAADAEQIGLQIADNVIDHMRSYITHWSALKPEDVSEIEAGVRSIIVAEIETAWPQPSTYEGKAEPVADAWQYRWRAAYPDGSRGQWNDWCDGRAPVFCTSNYESEERPLYAHPPAQPAPAVKREALLELVGSAFNRGFNEGMDEVNRSRGGKPWTELSASFAAKLDALLLRAQPSSEEGGQ